MTELEVISSLSIGSLSYPLEVPSGFNRVSCSRSLRSATQVKSFSLGFLRTHRIFWDKDLYLRKSDINRVL